MSLLPGSCGSLADTVTSLLTGQLRTHGLIPDKHKWCVYSEVFTLGPGVSSASCSVGIGGGIFPVSKLVSA